MNMKIEEKKKYQKNKELWYLPVNMLPFLSINENVSAKI